MAATVEEQMMVKAIREECPWETLPKRIQAAVVTKEEWHRRYDARGPINLECSLVSVAIPFISRNEFLGMHACLMFFCFAKYMKWQGRRLLHTETIAMEFLFLPQSMQRGGVLRGSDALSAHKSRSMSPGFSHSVYLL
jgi:hypothetical protein